jgi:hypothetical protein
METSGASQRGSEYAAAMFRNANSGGLQMLCRYHVINNLFIFDIEEERDGVLLAFSQQKERAGGE